MDPNVTLRKLREAVVELGAPGTNVGDAINDVVGRWSALDTWLSNGGFLPTQWTEAQRRALENTRNPVTSGGVAPSAQRTSPCPPPGDTVDEISDLLESDPWGPEPKLTRQQELLAEHVRREA